MACVAGRVWQLVHEAVAAGWVNVHPALMAWQLVHVVPAVWCLAAGRVWHVTQLESAAGCENAQVTAEWQVTHDAGSAVSVVLTAAGAG